MKFQIEESGGRISMLHKVAKEKKPYREAKPKQKRKPDYAGARQQKRGDFQD